MEATGRLTDDSDLELLLDCLKVTGSECSMSGALVILGTVEITSDNIELFESINSILPDTWSDIKELLDVKLRKYNKLINTPKKEVPNNIYYIPEGTFTAIDITKSLPITPHEVNITTAKQDYKFTQEAMKKISDAINALGSTALENNAEISRTPDMRSILRNLQHYTMFELLDLVKDYELIYGLGTPQLLLGFYIPKYHDRDFHGSKSFSRLFGMLFGIPKRIIKAQMLFSRVCGFEADDIISEYYKKYDTSEFSKDDLLVAIATNPIFSGIIMSRGMYFQYIKHTIGLGRLQHLKSWMISDDENRAFELYDIVNG
jgi:hypothetical protein